jgi:nitrate reductase NapA
VEKISGVNPSDLVELSRLYGDPNLKVMSFWTMGMNQHTRGTWINNLVHNLHLLTGKISTEKIWGLPKGTIPAKPTYHAIEMARALDRGDVLFFWSSTANPFQDYPNLNRYRKGAQKDGRFIVVSDVYPTRSTEIADVVLPTAMWLEKEGAFGNSERRTHFWKKMVDAPGESKSDLWQFIEFAKRMGHGKLFAYQKSEYPIPDGHSLSDASKTAGFYLEKALFEEYRKFGLGHGHDLAPFDVYHSGTGRGTIRTWRREGDTSSTETRSTMIGPSSGCAPTRRPRKSPMRSIPSGCAREEFSSIGTRGR